jgi:hypothetical protein
MPKVNEIDLVFEELKRPKSRRRKKVTNLITTQFIREIESEIVKINLYLTTKCIGSNNYRPHTGDEDHPLRERAKYLIDLCANLRKFLNP